MTSIDVTTQTLRVRSSGAPKGARKDFKRRIEEELHRFERFQLGE